VHILHLSKKVDALTAHRSSKIKISNKSDLRYSRFIVLWTTMNNLHIKEQRVFPLKKKNKSAILYVRQLAHVSLPSGSFMIIFAASNKLLLFIPVSVVTDQCNRTF